MDKQAIYNLKEYLERAALNGLGELSADAALKDAIDAFAAAAGNAEERRALLALRALRASHESERANRLLDTLTLLEKLAINCAGAEAPEITEPLTPGEGAYIRAPFSSFQPLLSALEGTGSGRISVIEDAWQTHPEFFAEARVLPRLIDALDGARDELEELLTGLLSALGQRAVPLLKSGAENRRPAAAARRVYSVARLAGAGENEWYVYLLPRSSKEQREAVIAALGCSQENAPLLRELYEREREKKCRDAVLRALSRMEDEDSRALWLEELSRRPDSPSCLEGVDAPLASDMAAALLRDAVEETVARGRETLTRAELLTLAHALSAACGKHSDAMRETWLWCAGQLDALEKLVPGQDAAQWELSAAEMLEKCLLETVLWNPCDPVCALAGELGERYPARFLSAVVLSELLLRPMNAFDRYGKLIVKNSILHRETPAERANRVQIMHALAAVRLDKDNVRHIPFSRRDMLTGTLEARRYRLRDFDPRWAQTLSDPRVNQDGAVYDLSNPHSTNKLLFQTDPIS